jgi:hypothetical protein
VSSRRERHQQVKNVSVRPKRAPTQPRSRIGVGPLLAVAGVAIIVVIGVIVISENRQTATPRADLPENRLTLGNASAPVTVEEWGDFQ